MKSTNLGILFFAGIYFFSCGGDVETDKESSIMSKDSHSFSQPEIAKAVHLDLNIEVNFEKKVLKGQAHYLISKSDNAKTIIFDTYDIHIEKVAWKNEELNFSLGKKDEIKGQALAVDLPDEANEVTIFYETSPDAGALQWLSPEQTAQKESSFLFTQSQAILARTWIPCQDSPGIRFTYNATVKVPKGFLALMSAENPREVNPDGNYDFKMPQPIPAYLMALTAGKIAFKEIGPRTGVYAEPNMLEKCYHEFLEMEGMLKSAEELYGPYAWGRYDVIVLPPSFPFGGMENPRLTFATPTIIAGDRSLTSLVAHELAHSWSGNLVTNATWDDFWLNEGFTVYFEQRIMEKVYGRDYSEMLALLSYRGLLDEIEEIGAKNPDDTKLKLNLKDRNPDDGMNAIAYDKGYLFLRKIEEVTSRQRFDKFLKNYFEANAFQTMDTDRFLELLKDYLSEKEVADIRINDWIFNPGLPDNHPIISSEKFKRIDEMMTLWVESGKIELIDTSNWSTHEYLHFINSLPANINYETVKVIDESFAFTNSGNCEILSAWLEVAIRSDYHEADEKLEEFLFNVGRRKFLIPAYKSLIKKDPSKAMARDIYRKARGNYHSVSRATLDELLDWKS